MGFMGMGYFVLIWLQTHSPLNSIWRGGWAFLVLVVIMSTMLYFGADAIKTRITYPRTGFVSYRKSSRVWGLVIAFAVAALVAPIAYTLSVRPIGRATPVFLVGNLVFIGLYIYRAALAVLWKWIVVATLAISAVAIVFLPPSALSSIAGYSAPRGFAQIAGAFLLLCFAWSTIFLISGSISLYIYVRNTPKPSSETE